MSAVVASVRIVLVHGLAMVHGMWLFLSCKRCGVVMSWRTSTRTSTCGTWKTMFAGQAKNERRSDVIVIGNIGIEAGSRTVAGRKSEVCRMSMSEGHLVNEVTIDLVGVQVEFYIPIAVAINAPFNATSIQMVMRQCRSTLQSLLYWLKCRLSSTSPLCWLSWHPSIATSIRMVMSQCRSTPHSLSTG